MGKRVCFILEKIIAMLLSSDEYIRTYKLCEITGEPSNNKSYKDTYTSIKYYTDNLIAYRKEGNDNDIYYFQGNKYIMNEDHDKNLFLFRYEACNGLYFYNFNKNTDLYEALEFHIKHILNINIGSLLVRQNYITDEYIDNDFRDGKFTRI